MYFHVNMTLWYSPNPSNIFVRDKPGFGGGVRVGLRWFICDSTAQKHYRQAWSHRDITLNNAQFHSFRANLSIRYIPRKFRHSGYYRLGLVQSLHNYLNRCMYNIQISSNTSVLFWLILTWCVHQYEYHHLIVLSALTGICTLHLRKFL